MEINHSEDINGEISGDLMNRDLMKRVHTYMYIYIYTIHNYTHVYYIHIILFSPIQPPLFTYIHRLFSWGFFVLSHVVSVPWSWDPWDQWSTMVDP